MEIITFSDIIEWINVHGEYDISPTSGLKNCPTPIEVAGGGRPESVWAQEVSKYIMFFSFCKNGVYYSKEIGNRSNNSNITSILYLQ